MSIMVLDWNNRVVYWLRTYYMHEKALYQLKPLIMGGERRIVYSIKGAPPPPTYPPGDGCMWEIGPKLERHDDYYWYISSDRCRELAEELYISDTRNKAADEVADVFSLGSILNGAVCGY